jgi:hypothetical protein
VLSEFQQRQGFFSSLTHSDWFSGPPSPSPVDTGASIPRCKVAWAWSWPLTTIQCQGYEHVELYLHSSIYLHNVVLMYRRHLYLYHVGNFNKTFLAANYTRQFYNSSIIQILVIYYMQKEIIISSTVYLGLITLKLYFISGEHETLNTSLSLQHIVSLDCWWFRRPPDMEERYPMGYGIITLRCKKKIIFFYKWKQILKWAHFLHELCRGKDVWDFEPELPDLHRTGRMKL